MPRAGRYYEVCVGENHVCDSIFPVDDPDNYAPPSLRSLGLVVNGTPKQHTQRRRA